MHERAPTIVAGPSAQTVDFNSRV